MRAVIRLLIAAALFAGPLVVAADLPGDSLYRLQPKLVDQDGRATTLDRYRGAPTIVGLFYTSCTSVCPLLLSSIQRTESALGEGDRRRLRVMLVSLDPAHDAPQALKAAAVRHGADLSRWTLARAPEADVRRLAAALGVQYRALPSGEINHSSPISLLDRHGRVVAQTSSLGGADAAFLERLRQELGRREAVR